MERSKIFIYEDSFLVPVSALHRISKAKFSFGVPKSVYLIQRQLYKCPLYRDWFHYIYKISKGNLKIKKTWLKNVEIRVFEIYAP